VAGLGKVERHRVRSDPASAETEVALAGEFAPFTIGPAAAREIRPRTIRAGIAKPHERNVRVLTGSSWWTTPTIRCSHII
jgi:hypothetical protein